MFSVAFYAVTHVIEERGERERIEKTPQSNSLPSLLASSKIQDNSSFWASLGFFFLSTIREKLKNIKKEL